jgi:hypothetical protein
MQDTSPVKSEKMYGVLLLGTIISCFIALYNNYPLVYPDTGSYLHSAWDNVVFYDRTIFYGLFIYAASWGGSSVFLMVFFQGLIVCYLIYLLLGIFFDGLKHRVIFLASVTGLTLFTGFSYTVSILIPDIFSSITILALFNLLVNRKMGVAHHVMVALIYIYSICTQFSSIPVLAGVFAVILPVMLYSIWKKKALFVSFKRFILAGLYTFSTLFIIPAVHYHYDGNFKISGSNHVFVMNHLLESGILEKYLEKACPHKNYRICEYKDSLGWDFIWSDKSPLQKTGGWEANRLEYKAIIKDIVSDDTFFWMLVRKGFEYTFKQFFTFQTTVSPSQMEGSAPFGQVKWRMPDTHREYISALQQSNKLDLRFVNFTELPLILISVLVLCIIILTPRYFSQLNPELKWLSMLLLLYSLVSSALCSNLSTVHPRFQNRIIWLIPLCLMIIVLKYREGIKERNNTSQNSENSAKD